VSGARQRVRFVAISEDEPIVWVERNCSRLAAIRRGADGMCAAARNCWACKRYMRPATKELDCPSWPHGFDENEEPPEDCRCFNVEEGWHLQCDKDEPGAIPVWRVTERPRSIIEWTDSTWNPWRGCDKVSPGCAHCYMFRDQERYGKDPSTVTRCADSTFYAPVKSRRWEAKREECIADHGRHLVFTCSWSDWFHEDADEWREEAWEVIRQTPRSTYQILTKRPERIAECLPEDWGGGYPNVWLGVTVENRRFVERASILGEIPAAIRFISAEPLLGPLIPDEMIVSGDPDQYPWTEWRWDDGYQGPGLPFYNSDGNLAFHWLITGGESGPGHRPFDPIWATELRDVCRNEGVAFLHKQNGGPRPDSNGRLLDGRTWDELPSLLDSPRAA
jgi:protein gp37